MCTDRYPYFQTYGQILNSNKYSTKYYDMPRILSFLIKKKVVTNIIETKLSAKVYNVERYMYIGKL